MPSGASHTGGRFAPFFVIFCVLRGWVPSGASHTAGGFATCAMTCPVVRGWVASGTSHTSGGVCTAWLACARVTCRVDLLVCMCACGCMCVCRHAGVWSDGRDIGWFLPESYNQAISRTQLTDDIMRMMQHECGDQTASLCVTNSVITPPKRMLARLETKIHVYAQQLTFPQTSVEDQTVRTDSTNSHTRRQM